ncbi:ABC transporter substrate-binding protein [Stygiolobus azoricus]|uniref:ABC transporter substrate-binding protein n=1 Tax=Stygiolobus azoricus TaxID=41675 RepID=A0A650CP43_9CREN|nr:ABC transporter substrate-binding protein [Stygiolobus azoricus]QGR19611.1 ABC transporter substrate-binding protein [Stygiolobus azoricus]
MNSHKLSKYLTLGIVLILLVPLTSSITTLAQTNTSNTLYIAWVTPHPFQSLSTYNPNLFAGGLGGSFYGLVYAYTALLNVSNNGIIPCLIENWSFSPPNWEQVWKNETVNVTMTLRHSGWANGAPVTAYDILATSLILDILGAPPYPNYTVINNYTIVISYPPGTLSPYLLPFTYLDTIGLGEVALITSYFQYKPLIQQIEGNWSQLQQGNTTLIKKFRQELHSYVPPGPISANYNGPFYVAEITPNEIILDKNPYYFAANNIKFNQVVIYQFSSVSSAEAAVLNGQVSIEYSAFMSLPSTLISSLPSYYEVINIPNPGGYALYFNFKNPWLSMVQVRQAIAYVLNRTSIVLAGGPKYSPVPIPNGIPNFTYYKQFITPAVENLNPYNTNLQKAAQLLESVGFTMKNGQWYTPNGTPFTLTILVPFSPGPGLINMLNVIENELTSFGIPTSYYVQTVSSVLLKDYETGQGYDLVMQAWGGYYPGTVDWFLETQYLNGIPYNVTQWDGIVKLPNGTQVNVTSLYKATIAPNSSSELISANDEMAYALNYYLPALPLVYESQQVIVNTHDLIAPPPNSWFWEEYFYGIGGTAINQLGITAGYFQPVTTSVTTTSTSSTTSVPTTVSVSTTTTTITITTSSSNTLAIAAVAVVIIIIVIIAAVLALRRRR